MTGLGLSQGTVIAGRFRLVHALGRGGMGEVWLAHHTGLDTPCAVKFIHPHVASVAETRARFEREAKVVAHLRSPHVVQVLDYGECEGIPYIAMEYLEGEDLGRRLKRVGRLAPLETYYILAQVCRALSKAHAAGLTHRDLKPENIFLLRDEDQELVKILDFGIAKSSMHAIAHGSTATGAILGTPNYMSPEQAQGTKAVDYRSDLWSVGVVAFRCMTGRLPFVSEALGDLLVQIIVNPLPVPSQVAPDVPPRFDGWWERAAARDPAQRFQSAKELIESLAVALNLSTSYFAHSGGPMAFANDPSRVTGLPQPSGSSPQAVGPAHAGAQITPGSFVVPATTPDPHASRPDAPPGYQSGPSGQLQDEVRYRGFEMRPSADHPSPTAPGLGPGGVAATIDERAEQPFQGTVPGISHTMAGVRARRARVGVVLASVMTVGVVIAGLVLFLKRPSAGEAEADAKARAEAEAASAAAARAAAPAPSATPTAQPSVEPAAPAPEAEASATSTAQASSKPAAPRAKATSTPRATPASPTNAAAPAPARPAPASTYNPGF